MFLNTVENIIYKYSTRKIAKYNKEININEINNEFSSLNDKYAYFHHYYWNLAPKWLNEHREYFKNEKRGFGEDAFHAMWYKIFYEFKPKIVLEIGIYRGQTISLFSLLSQKIGLKSDIYGVSPFSCSGDSVSNYLKDLDYYEDVKNNFKYFNLNLPTFYIGYSTDIEVLKKLDNIIFDLIYIDGNHDYEVAKQDFKNYSKLLKKKGLLVFDDASLFTNYKPSSYSTAGHPGPSKLVAEINHSIYTEILTVGHNRVFQKI